MGISEVQKFQADESEVSLVRGDIAIIGMSCIFPKAEDIDIYWQNITSKVDAIIDVPSDRWDIDTFFDPDPNAEEYLHCKRGGYLPASLPFNPLAHGIMPVVLEGAEPDQFLLLQLVRDALEDAGYLNNTNGKRTEIIVGKGNYLGAGHANLIQRRIVAEQTIGIIQDLHPEYTDDELRAIKKELLECLRKFNSETAPSLVPNITTGRVSNRLDFMGPNYTVDAACASSLIATDLAVKDLLTKKCDLAIVGGVHVCNDLPFLMLFEALHAVSETSQIRPFDKKADGTLTGEGLGVTVLKRLEDAERDEDRIYAVIKGVGTSSDGKATSVVAPRVEGGELALQRAYEMAGIDPKTVALIEAHGTGTVVGDASEIEILTRVLGLRDTESPSRCAVGTVKSMIGHAMPASGMAALIKTALALYHKILPPTLHCEEPNPKFELEKKSFYINTETRPWIHGQQDIPRRAGVNAFGLGGVNAHVVLEEYRGTVRSSANDGDKSPYYERMPGHHHYQWDTELFILQGDSRQALIQQTQQLQQYLNKNPQTILKDLAYILNIQLSKKQPTPQKAYGETPYRLAIVASSLDDLQKKLSYALQRLTDPECKQIKDIKGTFFFEEPLFGQGKLAFLFPGEGAQYLNMLLDLCLHFPEVRECFDRTDQAFINQKRDYLPSQIVFPPPAFTKEEQKKAEESLFKMDGALETVLTANWALTNLLDSLGIRPDMVVGHSSGEFSALLASGIAEAGDDYFRNLSILNTYYERAAADGEIPEAGMVAVGVDYDSAASITKEIDGEIYVAMDNCPHQVVVVGEEYPIQQAIEQFRSKGIMCEKLPFNRAYHTPMFEDLCEKLRAYFANVPMMTPKVEIYSCTTMAPFPEDPEGIRNLVIDHWMHPVKFRKTIEAMYDAGARIFVEIGPKGNLITFVDDILRGRPYLAMSSNVPRRSGITQLNHLIGILAAHGVPMHLDYLYARRSPQKLSLESAVGAPPDETQVENAEGAPPVEPLRKAEGNGRRIADNAMELRLDFPSLRISEERKEAAKQHQSKLREDAEGVPPVDATSPTGGFITSDNHKDERRKAEGESTSSSRLPEGASVTSESASIPPSTLMEGVSKTVHEAEGCERSEAIPAKAGVPACGLEGGPTSKAPTFQDSASLPKEISVQSPPENPDITSKSSVLQDSRNQPTQDISSASSTPGASNIPDYAMVNRESSRPNQHNHSQAMTQYMQTMEHFLEVQQQVMQAYLGREMSWTSQSESVEDASIASTQIGADTQSHFEDAEGVPPVEGQSTPSVIQMPQRTDVGLVTSIETPIPSPMQKATDDFVLPQPATAEIERQDEPKVQGRLENAEGVPPVDERIEPEQEGLSPQITIGEAENQQMRQFEVEPFASLEGKLREQESLTVDKAPSSEESGARGKASDEGRIAPTTAFAAQEINIQSLTQTLLGIVSEKTGYPIEMLDLNLDMEADLGIDSIKRIEILGSFQEQYSSLQSSQNEQVDMEQVASLKTLQQVIDFIDEQIGQEGLSPQITIGNGEKKENEKTGKRENETPPGIPNSDAEAPTSSLSAGVAVSNFPESSEIEQVASKEPSFPFIDSVNSLVPGQELVAVRRLDWKGEDIFMEDHTFGPEISGVDDTLKGLPVIPLTVGMEIMAEAAASLMPDKQLIAMKDIKAHQWIHLENPVTLQITAKRRLSSDEEVERKEKQWLSEVINPPVRNMGEKVHGASIPNSVQVEVQMWNPEERADLLTSPDSPLMEGIMVFSHSFPEPPPTEETFPLRSERPPKRTAKEVYDEHYLFHGPRFHNIVSLDRMGEDGLVGHLEVLPTDNLFKSNPNPSFITDPFLLDAVGQLVGYWPIENLETGFLIFPIRVQELILYGPTRPVSERVKCHLRVQEITSTRIRANIDVIGSDGRLWMRVVGWQDWRFYFPQDLFDFWRFTNRGMVSTQWNTPISSFPKDISESLECYQIRERFGDLGSTIWETVWAYLILNQNERQSYWNMVEKKLENRRMDWLFGRTTAKDAVRMWFKKHHGIPKSEYLGYPADIEIGEDDYGRPVPKGRWAQEIGIIPALSMAHADRMAVAITGPPNQRLGVDIEQIREREQGFETLAFTEEERTLLNSLEASTREEWITRFWCAKESVGKALGRGLIEGPKSLVVQELDAQTGTVKVALRGKLSEAFPEFAGAQIVAYTATSNAHPRGLSAKEENYIVASTICEIIR